MHWAESILLHFCYYSHWIVVWGLNAPEKYREQELTKARLLIDYYTIVGIDDIPEYFSSEKYRLEKSGNIIEDFDLMIGTTGVIGDLTVVTHNTKHFNRIEGIKLEDWTL